MKTPLLYLSFRFLFALMGCLAFTSASVRAQSAEEPRGLTVEEYTKVKTFTLADIDKDTYVKFENTYVLDRYEMKPPYVFKYSDGIERRFYLYKLMDNKTRKELGMVAIYFLPASNKTINLPIPNASADKTVWTRYIDDLKELGEKETGFLSAFSFMLSREMSSLMSAGTGAASTASQKKIDYDVCFPAGSLVTGTDGSQTPIETIRPGDYVAAYDAQTGKLERTLVKDVEIHTGKTYAITSVTAMRPELTASLTGGAMAAQTIEATANHPVLTKNGRRPMGELQTGDVLYVYDPVTNAFHEYAVQQVTTSARTVTQVYNLMTEKKNFLINNGVVLDK